MRPSFDKMREGERIVIHGGLERPPLCRAAEAAYNSAFSGPCDHGDFYSGVDLHAAVIGENDHIRLVHVGMVDGDVKRMGEPNLLLRDPSSPFYDWFFHFKRFGLHGPVALAGRPAKFRSNPIVTLDKLPPYTYLPHMVCTDTWIAAKSVLFEQARGF